MTLLVCAVLLAVALTQRQHFTLGRLPLVVVLAISAVVAEVVPFFIYTSSSERRWLAHGVTATCLLAAAALMLLRRRQFEVGCAVALVGMIATSAAVIRLDEAPRIDVWVILQQAADGMANGQNIYEMTWVDSPGIKDAFTYLPWTAALLAPGRWVAGDVRWALLVSRVVSLLLVG